MGDWSERWSEGWVDVQRWMGRWREGDGGMSRSREVDGWVIGARGGAMGIEVDGVSREMDG